MLADVYGLENEHRYGHIGKKLSLSVDNLSVDKDSVMLAVNEWVFYQWYEVSEYQSCEPVRNLSFHITRKVIIFGYNFFEKISLF